MSMQRETTLEIRQHLTVHAIILLIQHHVNTQLEKKVYLTKTLASTYKIQKYDRAAVCRGLQR